MTTARSDSSPEAPIGAESEAMEVSEDHVKLPKWVAVALVSLVFAAGGLVVRAELTAAALQREQIETRSELVDMKGIMREVNQGMQRHYSGTGHLITERRVERLEKDVEAHRAALEQQGRALSAICSKVGANCR